MAPDALPRRHVPFGGHQLAEYSLAAALAVVGLHLTGRPELVLVIAGGVLALFAVTSKGPLAAWRIVPRKLHLYIDLPLAACFALSPLVYVPSFPLIPIIISEAVAFVMVRMSLMTEIDPRPRPERGGRRKGSSPAGAYRADGGRAGALGATEAPDAVTVVAGTAGRLLGTAVKKARGSGAPLAAARGLGRATGHARRIGRAATAAGKEAPRAPQPVVVPDKSPGRPE